MKFKKTEKEWIKAIVKYGEKEKSLADVINKSKLLEKRGIGIVPYGGNVFVFLSKKKYDWDDKDAYGYLAEMMSVVDTLVEKKLITLIPFDSSCPPVIGKEDATLNGSDMIKVDGDEVINMEENKYEWANEKGDPIYTPWKFTEEQLPVHSKLYPTFSVSEELKDLVKHDFKTEEQRRFEMQTAVAWIAIFVALIIALLGIFYG